MGKQKGKGEQTFGVIVIILEFVKIDSVLLLYYVLLFYYVMFFYILLCFSIFLCFRMNYLLVREGLFIRNILVRIQRNSGFFSSNVENYGDVIKKQRQRTAGIILLKFFRNFYFLPSTVVVYSNNATL